jgi:hypothetical protein
MGFKKEYETNGEMRRFFKCLTALVFVPIPHVESEFCKLKTIYTAVFGDELKKFLNYFEDVYLYSEKYEIKMWSCRYRYLNNIPLTNNILEGFHSGLKSIFPRAHPSVTILCMKLD